MERVKQSSLLFEIEYRIKSAIAVVQKTFKSPQYKIYERKGLIVFDTKFGQIKYYALSNDWSLNKKIYSSFESIKKTIFEKTAQQVNPNKVQVIHILDLSDILQDYSIDEYLDFLNSLK